MHVISCHASVLDPTAVSVGMSRTVAPSTCGTPSSILTDESQHRACLEFGLRHGLGLLEVCG